MVNALPRKAWAYLLAVVAGGLALLVFTMDHSALDMGQVIGTIVAIVIASIAQLLKVEGPTTKTSYNLGLVVYGFAFVLLGARGAILVAVCASLVEWLWHRYPWFIQSFNICTLVIDLTAAGMIYSLVSGQNPASSLLGIVGLVAAAASFVVLNHLMVGIMIRLGRGEGFSQAGVLGRLTLAIDATLFGIGIAAALLWRVSPYAAAIALAPLYLLATTLRMPSLQRQAVTDPKTGLFHARYFEEALARELARANRYDRPLTLVVGDLDLLRNINNTYGHLAGDEVLVGIAELMKAHFRDYDVISRFGGEEFAVLMPETSLHEASGRVETLRSAIENAQFEVQTSVTPIGVTMSFGLAERARGDTDGPSLLHRADVAVYHAKRDGRNRVRLASSAGDDILTATPESAGKPAATAVRPMPPAPAHALGVTDENVPPDRPPEPPQRPEQAPPAEPAVSDTSSKWKAGVYIAFVGAAALAATIVSLKSSAFPAPVGWSGVALFFTISVLAESLSIDIYVRDSSVSTSAAPFIAAAILFGPLAVIATSVGLATAAMIKHHSTFSRLVFNTSAQLLAGFACVWLAHYAGGLAGGNAWLQLGVSMACAIAVFLITTGSVAGAISLTVGESFGRIWFGQFRWLLPYYVGLGALASGLALSFKYAGLAGVLAVTVPLLILRYAQKQYLDHTKSLVGQLRRNNAELFARTGEVEALNEELLQVLSNVVDLRDPFVLGHSRQVSKYATLIAHEMGLPESTVEVIRRAGLLHDIGKLGISEGILQKPARLTEAEYETVKTHSELAEAILRDCNSLGPLILIVRHHHERFDGSGYPQGLSAGDIPLESRILAVADAVEAMASDRPYRLGSSATDIIRELRDTAGTQFDPAVVDAMCRVILKEGKELILNSATEVSYHMKAVIEQDDKPWSTPREAVRS
jgi:diguanylate cyclase (GGDEF)-like protein/putative nucleotidyltransferase with HDIG domain